MTPLTRREREALRENARAAMGQAYAPYSKYRVGAALLTRSGEIVTACNVENASYGLSICGERSAVFAAVAQGHRDFRAVAVCSGGALPWPCGACRQVLNEFAPDLLVIVESGDGRVEERSLTQLLPESFRLGE